MICKKIKYCYANNCYVNIYKSNKQYSTLVYIHGGGLTSGTAESDEKLFANYNNNGISVVSVNYSLYPKTKFPEFIIECAKAVKWLSENSEKYELNDTFFIQGQSAGAYIAMMLCFNESYLETEGVEKTRINGYIFDSPQPTSHFNVLKERGLDSRLIRVDETAPIYYIHEKEYPPVLLISYTDDMPCRLAQNTVVYETIKYLEIKSPFYFNVLEGEHCSGSCIEKDGKFLIERFVYDFVGKLATSH